MKKSDIATVILIAAITTIITALTVNAILGDPNEQKVEVSYMDLVTTTIVDPDEEVFNAQAISPTVEVYVGSCKDDENWDADKQECVERKEENGETNEPEDDDVED